MKTFMKIAVPVALLALAACAGDKTRQEGTGEGAGSATAPYGTGTGAAGSSVVGRPGALGAGGLPTGRVLYFAFDSSELSEEGVAIADAWGQFLAANPNAKVRLEGHCDERGTREYNVGLGERRANAVLQALTSRGVGARQISVSSFGEERPVAMGHDESAWTQNRRVEIVQ